MLLLHLLFAIQQSLLLIRLETSTRGCIASRHVLLITTAHVVVVVVVELMTWLLLLAVVWPMLLLCVWMAARVLLILL